MTEAMTASALGEIATEAASSAPPSCRRGRPAARISSTPTGTASRKLGGLVLIDEDPDYLSVAPDGSFRSRTRYQDEVTGEWRSETEVIESAAELVELYNPAEIYAAFAEAAREQAGLPEEPTGAEDLMDVAGIAPDETVGVGVGGTSAPTRAMPARPTSGRAARSTKAAPQDAGRGRAAAVRPRADFPGAQPALRGAAASSSSRSLRPGPVAVLGDLMILDDEDERLWLKRNGRFEAEVVPERERGAQTREGDVAAPVESPDDMVEFYDPTDVFGDLAEALAEAFPDVAADEEDARGRGPARTSGRREPEASRT